VAEPPAAEPPAPPAPPFAVEVEVTVLPLPDELPP